MKMSGAAPDKRHCYSCTGYHGYEASVKPRIGGGQRPETDVANVDQYHHPRVKTGSFDRKIESDIDHARELIIQDHADHPKGRLCMCGAPPITTIRVV